MMQWTPETRDKLRTMWGIGLRPSEIAREFGSSEGAIRGEAIRLQLHSPARPELVAGLRPDHPALAERRSLFPKAVVDPPPPKSWGAALNEGGHVLKSGANQRKLGSIVTKGAWRGMPIFSLSLEERATCPADCANWASCYANAMPFATRYRHGPQLERSLEADLAGLQHRFPAGFVVRCHLVGDFYSVEYLNLWSGWLDRFPALHVFGYTAWDWLTDIGAAVAVLAFQRWDRFAVRLSSREPGIMRAVTVWEVPDKRTSGSVIPCPAQTGGAKGCGECGLCWSPAARTKTIAFIAHGPNWAGRPANG